MHCFPSIDSKLKCPYYVIVGSPRKQVKCPWSIPQSLPPTIAVIPSDSEQLHNPPVSKHCLYFYNFNFMYRRFIIKRKAILVRLPMYWDTNNHTKYGHESTYKYCNCYMYVHLYILASYLMCYLHSHM